jgi:predicted nucleic acid-binding protein
MIISPVHLIEINAISEIIERNHIFNFLKRYGIQFNLKQVKVRAEELVNLKFGIADAAHLAFAEIAQAYFISCDEEKTTS